MDSDQQVVNTALSPIPRSVGLLQEIERYAQLSNEIACAFDHNMKVRLTQGTELIFDVEGDRYYGEKTIQTMAFFWLCDFMAALYEVATACDNATPWDSSWMKDVANCTAPSQKKTLSHRLPLVVA